MSNGNWQVRWQQIGAAGGFLFVLLQLAAQSLIQIGGAEPAFNAPAGEILDFFAGRNRLLAPVGDFLSFLSFIAFIWFLGVLWGALKQAEGEPAWLSLVVFGSGLLSVAASNGGWTLALLRLDDGLEPQMARLLFDMGNFGFAASWVWLASFLLAGAVLITRTAALPRWLGWGGALIALLLLAARAVWAAPSPFIFLPYVLYWLWLIAASILLMRRLRRAAPAGA